MPSSMWRRVCSGSSGSSWSWPSVPPPPLQRTPEAMAGTRRSQSPLRAAGLATPRTLLPHAVRPRRPRSRPARARAADPRPLARRRHRRRRPVARAPATSRGSSTRARPPPTGGPACTTSGPGCSRTSTRASRPCGAARCRARAAGTATACRWSSRSRRSSGSRTKHEIEAFGIAEFNQRCRESVHRYVDDWEALTERAGVWIDTADAYWTLDNDYVESVWWLVRQLWDKGLLYEGHKVSPYCGRCGTALSSHELGQPDVYRDVVDPSGLRALPRRGPRRRPAGLDHHALDPHLQRGRRRRARHRLRAGRRASTAAVTSSWPPPARPRTPRSSSATPAPTWSAGATSARSTFLAPPPGADGWRVVAADFVTTDDGSGIVHLAPAFGEDDAAVGRAEKPPRAQPGRRRRRLRRVRAARTPDGSSRTPTATSSPTSPPGACSCASRPTSTATPTAGGAARR